MVPTGLRWVARAAVEGVVHRRSRAGRRSRREAQVAGLEEPGLGLSGLAVTLLPVGGNQARRWTPTQQLPGEQRPPLKGTRPKAPSETNGTLLRKLPPR
jgi:hypothetical protein